VQSAVMGDDRHRLDLDEQPREREPTDLDQGARRSVGAEVGLSHLVNPGTVIHVRQVNRDLHDVVERGAARGENAPDVLERLPSLGDDVAWANQTALAVSAT
jgi:hypothetical protein